MRGYSIKQGATTTWERWNAWTKEHGFIKGMNSFSHYSFGAVGQWMLENIGGIHSASPGYKRILIRPRPGGKLARAEVGYRSIRGLISTKWEINGSRLSLDVTIPPNTTASVHVPAKSADDVREGGKPVRGSRDVKFLRMEDGAAVVEIGGGDYSFTSRSFDRSKFTMGSR